MQCHEVIGLLKELKLHGMSGVFDETISQGIRRQKPVLARISHKDRDERPESAGNAGLQRQKARRHIEIFRGCFLGL